MNKNLMRNKKCRLIKKMSIVSDIFEEDKYILQTRKQEACGGGK